MTERRPDKSKFFDWTEGIPVPRYADPFTKQNTTHLIGAAAAMPYVQPELRDLNRFNGMTALEVAACRNAEAAGDGDQQAYSLILDRILGKPKQENQNVNVAVTYADYLEEVGQRFGIPKEEPHLTIAPTESIDIPEEHQHSVASQLDTIVIDPPTKAFRKYTKMLEDV